MALDVVHSCASRIFLEIALDVLPQCGNISGDMQDYKSLMPVSWDLQVASQVSDFSVEKWVWSLPRFLSFLPWKTCASSSSSADSLPLTRSYLLRQQKPAQFSSHSRVPTWVLPVPAVEKHPLLGQEHPALLDRPDRADSRAGCECDRKQYNTDGIGPWSGYSELFSRLLGYTPILTSGPSSKNTKPYYSLPTLDLSTKCTLGDWFLRNVTLDLW